jgi:enolase-phosphatase E1
VLLDIEGTTTPVEFVHQRLFGYARERVSEFLQRYWNDPDVRADVSRLALEHAAESSHPAPPPWREDAAGVVPYLHWLMQQDRKSTGLKSLQGKIWEEGYRAGDLKSEVYPDVPPALERWRGQGIDIAIFSSGSVQAQRSLFQNTNAGDLTPLIGCYFDTTTGAKTAAQSYSTIAAALERSTSDILFVSDLPAELDGAQAAGMRTALCVRSPGSAPRVSPHPIIHTFDQLSPRNNLKPAGVTLDTPRIAPETDGAISAWMQRRGWEVTHRGEMDPDSGFHVWQQDAPPGGRSHALWIADSMLQHLSAEELVEVLNRERVAEEIRISFKVRIEERGAEYRVSVVPRKSGEFRKQE